MNNSTVFVAVALALSVILVGCGQPASDHFSAADTAYREGDYEKAVELLTQAANESDNPAIYANRGNCYSSLGNLDAALKDYNTAIEKAVELSGDANDPGLASLYYNRGYAFEHAKRYKQAIPDYEKTISLDDEYPDVKNNLAWILATCPDEKIRDPQRAITIAKAECEKTGWKNDSLLDTLAAGHASAGDFTKAIERQEQAIELARDPEAIKDFQARLKLYRNSKPFVESATNN